MRSLDPCVWLLFAAAWLLQLGVVVKAQALVDLLTENPKLNVMSAGYLSQNKITEPPITIFAPTDEAFIEAISQGSLLCAEGRRCIDLLDWVHSSDYSSKDVLRHVFQGRLQPENFQDGMVLVAIDGSRVKVEHEDDWELRVGGALISTTGSVIQAEDGVIVIVNTLLIDYSRINVSDIGAAELVVDIGPFARDQRTVMVEEVSENVNCYRKVRALGLSDGAIKDHSVLAFNPDMYQSERKIRYANGDHKNSRKPKEDQQHSGKDLETPNQIKWPIPEDVKRPKDDEDLAYMTVLELASLLRQGKVTSTELAQLYIDRLKRYDPVLEIVVTFTEELAYEQAAAADAEIKEGNFRSPLHGIPYGLKDLIAVPDYPTTWGAAPFKNQTFDEGAWCYEKLKAAGAVLVAKLATGAMAWGDVWFGGRTKNPWNVAEGSCGSSSGSGAATVAGLLPFAIGTETWGSMSCPSETMGVTGFRPTFGSIGRTGVMTLASSLDKVGPFCRVAMDCGVITEAMLGKDPEDPGSVDATFQSPVDVDISSLRIGFARNADVEVVNELRNLGAKMVPVKLNFTVNAKALMNTILGSEAGAHFDSWLRSDKSRFMREQHKWPSYIRSARLIPAVEYIQANRARGRLMKEVHELFEGLDALVLPARGRGEEGAMGNVLGLPQIVFPTGYSPLSGNVQSSRKDPKAQAIMGLPFSDHKVLAVGHAYQLITKTHLERPPIDKVEQSVLDVCLPFSKCDPSTLSGPPKIKLEWTVIGGSD